MSETAYKQTRWWGQYKLAESEAACWRIGPSTIWIKHLKQEWRVVHNQVDDPLDNVLQVDLPALVLEPEQVESVNRFSFSRSTNSLAVMPVLADRAVVVRPAEPFFVLSGEEVTLYVSTPLWIRVQVGNPLKQLCELSSYRPSDTWFGPSTLEGELCYASRTAGRLELQELPFRPHRVITPIKISNRAKDHLLLERVKLPVQYLSLYGTANNFLWTQAVTLDREEGGDLAALRLGKGAPTEAGKVERIAEPRQQAERNLVVRAFSKLFSSRGNT